NAIFHGTKFGVGAKPSFRGTKFLEGAFFQAARFEDPAEFNAVQFSGEARFHGTVFLGSASFAFSVFGDEAHFTSGEGLGGVAFHDSTSFEHVQFTRHAGFGDAVFRGDVVLREAYLAVGFFATNGRVGDQEQFQAGIDLRGCTYERIQVDWRSFLRRGDGNTRLSQFDRQPYDQLKKMFRAAGEDRTADEVYLERRRVTRIQLSQTRRLSWLRDWIYWQSLNYGVRPYHLIVYAVIALALGTLAFQSPRAIHESKTA